MTKEQRQHSGAKKVFSTNGVGINEHSYAKKKRILDTDLTPFTKIKSKWIKDINVMHRSIKLLQDSRRNLDVLGYAGGSLGTTPKIYDPQKK